MTALCVEKGGAPWPVDPHTRMHERHRVRHRVKVTHSGGAVRASHALVYDCLGYDSDPERDAVRTLARAKEKLVWRTIALQADHLLTLTYRECVDDLEVSRKHLRLFWKLVKRHIEGFKFVGVAEWQERGAVHWHLALKGFHDVNLLRRLWRGVLQADGLQGNIDIKFFHGKSSEAIASYISKYLGKGFDVGDKPRYSHYYVTSRGLVFETVTYHCFGYSDDEIAGFVEDLISSLGGVVRTRWRSSGSDIERSGGMRTW